MKNTIDSAPNQEKARKFFIEGCCPTLDPNGVDKWGIQSASSPEGYASFEAAMKDVAEILDMPKPSLGEDLRIIDEEGRVHWPKSKEEGLLK